jgi:hypothetical protein
MGGPIEPESQVARLAIAIRRDNQPMNALPETEPAQPTTHGRSIPQRYVLAWAVMIVGLVGFWCCRPFLGTRTEWAYAGMLFDLTGAAASHAACGHPVSEIATPLVILGIVMASWVLRPESRALRDAAGTPIGLFPPKQPEARFETTN